VAGNTLKIFQSTDIGPFPLVQNTYIYPWRLIGAPRRRFRVHTSSIYEYIAFIFKDWSVPSLNRDMPLLCFISPFCLHNLVLEVDIFVQFIPAGYKYKSTRGSGSRSRTSSQGFSSIHESQSRNCSILTTMDWVTMTSSTLALTRWRNGHRNAIEYLIVHRGNITPAPRVSFGTSQCTILRSYE
jgi:hypothetical protein